jgi:glycosyltransferase involved in cell wall biosynthesis
MLAEVGKSIDRDRVVFPGRIPYIDYLTLLRRSDAHVYLTYPFVASWSLREALAMGCAVIGSDTQPVQEFISHGKTGLLVPCLKPHAVASQVLDLLDDKALTRALRSNARTYAEKHLAMADYLASYERIIERLTGGKLSKPSEPEAALRRPPPIGRQPAEARSGRSKAAQVRRRFVTAA